MDEIRDAGFNVAVSRRGGQNLDTVRDHAEMAQERGLFNMAWIECSLYLNPGQTGPTIIGANGKTVSTIFSPNADEFWNWLTPLIVGQARISAEFPALIGAFFDFEGYAMKGVPGNYYPLSYDDVILTMFTRAEGIKRPELAAAERYPWLNKQGLHDAFAKFQIDYWRQRFRELRQRVDAINPAFQFIVYPIPGTLFTIEAFMPELATERAPMICADAASYDRTTGIHRVWLSHADGLRMNRFELGRNMKLPHVRAIPHQYTGGLDPSCAGADPEFCGKNAASVAQTTNGYWVFYEGLDYDTKRHRDYFRWFKQANRAIETRRFDFWRQPREDPDPRTIASEPGPEVEFNRFKTDKPKLGELGCSKFLLAAMTRESTFEVHRLESLALRYLERYDVVVLHTLTVKFAADDPIVIALRRYVEDGGGLLLASRTGWYLDHVFPEVARRGGCSEPSRAGSSGTCRDNKYVVAKSVSVR